MTPIKARLDGIEAREKAATKGPWCLWDGFGPIPGCGHYAASRLGPQGASYVGINGCGDADIHGEQADLEFLACSRSDIPFLLSLARAAVELADRADAVLCDIHDVSSGPVRIPELQAALARFRALADGKEPAP